MDSPNPYTQRSNFMDLLSSQQDSHYPQHIPYVSFSQTIPEIPLFSTQGPTDDPSVDEETSEVSKERKRWTPREDLVLISSWLNTSKDVVVSNQQKSASFWTHIATLYADSPSIGDGEKRESNHCKQRWRKINDQVSKFCGAYAAAVNIPKSGHAEKDEMKLAHQIFFNDYKAKFTLEHAWNELKTEQKWRGLSATKDDDEGEGSSKKRRTAVASAQSGSSRSVTNAEDETMVRPPGVKASKDKKTVAKLSTMEEEERKLLKYQRMWEIKEKDLDMNHRLTDKKVLDHLLGRTKPLSEQEMALKTKLINKLYEV